MVNEIAKAHPHMHCVLSRCYLYFGLAHLGCLPLSQHRRRACTKSACTPSASRGAVRLRRRGLTGNVVPFAILAIPIPSIGIVHVPHVLVAWVSK